MRREARRCQEQLNEGMSVIRCRLQMNLSTGSATVAGRRFMSGQSGQKMMVEAQIEDDRRSAVGAESVAYHAYGLAASMASAHIPHCNIFPVKPTISCYGRMKGLG